MSLATSCCSGPAAWQAQLLLRPSAARTQLLLGPRCSPGPAAARALLISTTNVLPCRAGTGKDVYEDEAGKLRRLGHAVFADKDCDRISFMWTVQGSPLNWFNILP